MCRGVCTDDGTKSTKCITGSLDTLDAVADNVRVYPARSDEILTQCPFRRIDEDSEVFVSQPMRWTSIVLDRTRLKRKRSVKLNLTLNGEVVKN